MTGFDTRLKDLLGMVASVEDELRSESSSEEGRARSRSRLLSSLEDPPSAAQVAPERETRRIDQFVLDQLDDLIGGQAARRALEQVGATLGQRPEALAWDACEAVGVALHPILAELVGVEIADSVVERIHLGKRLQGRP